MKSNRIAVGTAQFGLDYGISNRAGQVSKAEAEAILRLAKEHEIDTLDTAVLYGNSESLLGDIGTADWRIISKLPEMPEDVGDPSRWLDGQVAASLKRLNATSLAGLLLHRPEQLLGVKGDELYDALMQQKKRGSVERVGISVYRPGELDEFPTNMRFDIVQTPFNVLDNRLIESGWMERLREADCELHVRSIFLQGLLLMRPDERPVQFAKWNSLWRLWQSWLGQHGLTPLQACLRYALSFREISKIIIGVQTASQLEQVLAASKGDLPPMPDELQICDERLINPALWERQ